MATSTRGCNQPTYLPSSPSHVDRKIKATWELETFSLVGIELERLTSSNTYDSTTL
ncbi:hypothetical protein BGX38DRAFT_1198535 [Terfezia claveryi]|nr:hypothetical protein BGX38DRAFT_1244908 [Terfezia claveryi]KAF8444206.1 hypothetical protein BGX38DRAFT_1198535 [Terfezia claveryi]